MKFTPCPNIDRPAPWGSGKPCRHPEDHRGSCAAVMDNGGKQEHRWSKPGMDDYKDVTPPPFIDHPDAVHNRIKRK